MLKPVEQSDLEKILAWRNSPEVRKNMYTGHVISWQEHLDWFERLQADSTRLCFKFNDGLSDCGIVNFTRFVPGNGDIFWGFYASPDAPGGTGLKIEYDALCYAFDTLGIHKLNCEVLAFNKKVINLHKKSGFLEEGYFRDFHHSDGQYFDVVRLGMLTSEWTKAKGDIEKRLAAMQG